MRKAIKTICAILAIAGLMAAVCCADESTYEMAIRGGGVAAFTFFAFIGGFMK